jgi:3-oxoacyl-[acyl-carrier protein] reductase
MHDRRDAPVTVITGTRRGIGADLARYYLQQGHLVVGCSRQPIDWHHERYTHFTLDVADEAAVRELFRTVRTSLGRVDHLINNAGIASMNHALVTPLSSVNAVLATNVAGTFLFCREAAKQMQKRRYGRIVNFSTVAVPLKLAGEAVYAASKAAVETLTAVLAQELGEFGITVNAVGPGPVDTDLIRGVPKEKIDALVSRQAIRRKTTTADIANVVDFFLADTSGMVTGQTLYLGGV